MAQLRGLNQRLCGNSASGKMEQCNTCEKPSTERCARCLVKYCSKVRIQMLFSWPFVCLILIALSSRNAKAPIGRKVDIDRSARLSLDFAFGIAQTGVNSKLKSQNV